MKELDKILNDKVSGSSELLRKLNLLIKKNLHAEPVLYKIIEKSENSFSEFSVISDYLKTIKTFLSANDLKAIENYVVNFDKLLEHKYEKIYLNAKKELKRFSKFLTLSNSKTLQYIFTKLKNDIPDLFVVVCESRPKLEGRLLAKALLKANVKTEFISDAMISLYIPKTDAVICGADSILKNGSVVNKVGSMSAALLANHFNKKFYVVSSSDKFSETGYFNPVEKPSEEIWNYKNQNLKVSNYYFEIIPGKLITKIITE